ncbi:MAG: hypothetical protein IJA22_01290 [Clostridia bacterium]|nr:hypothetical protein [Clostridia bacterium]
MKNKKFKLFASLTSLVMVVAVMAVGVWAATTASGKITGTVSFNATGIVGNIQISNVSEGVLVNGEEFTSNVQVAAFTTGTTQGENTQSAAISYEFIDNTEGVVDGFIKDAEAEFTIELTINNTGSVAATYTITFENNAGGADKVVAAAEDGKATGNLAASTGTQTVEITYTLQNHSGAAVSTALPNVIVTMNAAQ